MEPELARAERHAVDEFFAENPTLSDGKTTPGVLLLQRLLDAGDERAVSLFRAMEMLHHELSRHGYAAAYRLGQESGEGCCGCE